MDVLDDLQRIVLTIGWGIAAVYLWKAASVGPAVHRPIRLWGAWVSIAWVVYYISFFVAIHTSLSVSWHNEASRAISYMTAAIFVVWGLLSYKRKRGVCIDGMGD